MARKTIKYTLPGTVAHGHVIKDGKAVFTSFEIEGVYKGLSTSEKFVRKTYDNSFTIESVTHYGKVYEMPIEHFIKVANLVDIIEKEGNQNG